MAGDGATLAWDRALTDNVDAECELGVVIGATASDVAPATPRHVFGYTMINDVTSRDEWLDGDQWLLGKSMPGFCPVGPWVVTADELDPADIAPRLHDQRRGDPGRRARRRCASGSREIVAYLGRHLVLRPGDLIATGTPARLTSPPGPDRRLRPGDRVTCWIEGIGELTTHIGSNEEHTR